MGDLLEKKTKIQRERRQSGFLFSKTLAFTKSETGWSIKKKVTFYADILLRSKFESRQWVALYRCASWRALVRRGGDLYPLEREASVVYGTNSTHPNGAVRSAGIRCPGYVSIS